MAKRKGPAARKINSSQKRAQKSAPAAGPSRQSRASSFLMGQHNEMGKQRGKPKPNEEYVQPDEDQEIGGEG